MADMAIVVNGDAASVHGDLSGVRGTKSSLLPVSVLKIFHSLPPSVHSNSSLAGRLSHSHPFLDGIVKFLRVREFHNLISFRTIFSL